MFKTSNGSEFRKCGVNTYEMYNSGGAYHATFNTEDETFKDLTEFVQHLRDKELGRWRWPENPDYVIYRNTLSDSVDFYDPAVKVIRETTGDTYTYRRSVANGKFNYSRHSAIRAAYWYFTEIHSEEKEHNAS